MAIALPDNKVHANLKANFGNATARMDIERRA
jgi:hypothetical protein